MNLRTSIYRYSKSKPINIKRRRTRGGSGFCISSHRRDIRMGIRRLRKSLEAELDVENVTGFTESGD